MNEVVDRNIPNLKEIAQPIAEQLTNLSIHLPHYRLPRWSVIPVASSLLLAMIASCDPTRIAAFNPNHDLGNQDNHTLVLSSRELRGTPTTPPARHIVGIPTPQLTPLPTAAAFDLGFTTAPDMVITPANAPFSPVSFDYFLFPQNVWNIAAINVVNYGPNPSPATFVRGWIDLTGNGSHDITLPAQPVRALPFPGNIQNQSAQFVTWKHIWSDPQPVGTHEFTFCVDVSPGESNTSNNCFTKEVKITRANLIVRNMTLSTMQIDSQHTQINVGADTVNIGNEASNAGGAVAPLRISDDDYTFIYPTIVTGIGQFSSQYPNLNPGQSAHVSFTGIYSTSALSDETAVMIYTDAGGSTAEERESDNYQTMTFNQIRSNSKK